MRTHWPADIKLLNLRVQLASLIPLEHLLEVQRLDLAGLAGTAEGFVAGYADIGHGDHGGLEEFTRVELGRVLGHETTNSTGTGETQVGVDVDLANTVLDAFDDFFHRYTVGFRDFTTEFVDDL